jgi:hypothetical protein
MLKEPRIAQRGATRLYSSIDFGGRVAARLTMTAAEMLEELPFGSQEMYAISPADKTDN